MKVLQLYYGFYRKLETNEILSRTLAISDEISDIERNEIEEYCRAMLGINMNNFEVLCNKDFAPAYACLKIKSGGLIFCNLKYIHSNEDNCEGFFWHVLFNREGSFNEYPMQIKDSPIFKLRIYYSDEVDKVAKLPALSEVPIENRIDYEIVAKFIKISSENSFRKLVSAVTDSMTSRYPVIISDLSENIILWITAVQMAFPVKMSESITFSTCSGEINSLKCTICGVSNYSIKKEGSEEEHFYLFDFIRNRITFHGNEYKFARVADLGYTASRDIIITFHKFIELFNYGTLDSKIETCYNLFTLVNLGIGNSSYLNIKEALDFAQVYGSQKSNEQVFSMMSNVLGKMSLEVNTGMIELIASFLLRIANETRSLVYYDRIYNFVISSMDHMVLNGESDIAAEMREFYKRFKEINKERKENFLKYQLNTKRFKLLLQKLSAGTRPHQVEFYVEILIGNLIESGYNWKRAIVIDGMKQLMEICFNFLIFVKWDLTYIFEASSVNCDFLVDIAKYAYDKMIANEADNEGYYRALAKVFADKSTEWKKECIAIFHMKIDGDKILLREFVNELEISEDPIEFFNEYFSITAEVAEDYLRKNYSSMLGAYMSYIGEGRFSGECSKILINIIDNGFSVEDTLLPFIIKGFEESLSLYPPGDELRHIIPLEIKLKKSKNVRTSPDMAGLLELGLFLESSLKASNRVIAVSDILGGRIDINNLASIKFVQYIDWCLPMLIRLSDSPEDHRAIIVFLNYIEDYILELYRKYLGIVKNILEEEERGYKIFIDFSVYYFYYVAPRSIDDERKSISLLIKEGIKEILLNFHKDKVAKYEQDVINEFNSMRLSAPRQVQEICKEVLDSNGKSFIGRIFKGFGRG